jgi:hypothetical protein
VAGLTLALSSARSSRFLALPRNCRPFASGRGGDIRLELSEEAIPETSAEALLFDSGGVWRVYRRDGGYLYTFRTPRLSPSVYKAVTIDAGLARGVLHYPPPRRGRLPRHALDFPLDELLFQHRFARAGAFEVHACGLVVDGGAVLFPGKSGAGKSTTARLWRRHRPGTLILSDDRIVVRPRRGGFQADGTPWHGEGRFAAPAGRALRAVFFLRQSRGTRLARLCPPEAAGRLFTRTFPPAWDAEAVARVLETCARVATEVPCYELAFRPDAGAIEAVTAVL